MSYRDDREALHNRVAQLEEELKDARREGQEEGRDEAAKRAASLEEKIGEMKGELERMELELQAMRGERPKTAVAPRTPIFIALGAVFAIGGFAFVFALRKTSAPPPPPVIVMPTATPSPMVPAVPEPTAVKSAVPLATAAAPVRTTTARWNAKVTKAEGLAIGGAACTIDANIATNNATNAVIKGLVVSCGGQKLYDSADKLEGMAQMSNDARELLGPSDEKSTFTLAYRDIGSRMGERTQIDFDTNAKQGSVWKETVPRFRVDLAIPKESAPGAPLTTAADRLKRTGKLSEITGSTLKPGAACTLRAMPNGKREECVAEVACGTTILWPTSTPVKCTYEGSRPATVEAKEEGDLSLELHGSMLGIKTKATTATIELED